MEVTKGDKLHDNCGRPIFNVRKNEMNLTTDELNAMVASMAELDFGPEIDIEIVDEDDFDYEDDGQPTEYEEWQDVYGGDDWDHGQYDHDYYDGGVDF
tara:strand:- start:581 stop:874 length:294 start_codon:yes stop_codon:yes gene_type:complete